MDPYGTPTWYIHPWRQNCCNTYCTDPMMSRPLHRTHEWNNTGCFGNAMCRNLGVAKPIDLQVRRGHPQLGFGVHLVCRCSRQQFCPKAYCTSVLFDCPAYEHHLLIGPATRELPTLTSRGSGRPDKHASTEEPKLFGALCSHVSTRTCPLAITRKDPPLMAEMVGQTVLETLEDK